MGRYWGRYWDAIVRAGAATKNRCPSGLQRRKPLRATQFGFDESHAELLKGTWRAHHLFHHHHAQNLRAAGGGLVRSSSGLLTVFFLTGWRYVHLFDLLDELELLDEDHPTSPNEPNDTPPLGYRTPTRPYDTVLNPQASARPGDVSFGAFDDVGGRSSGRSSSSRTS